MERVKLIECPRDAWQGLQDLIPAEYKAEYLKELALAGFRHIDAVSFVSPKHVKQMADSEEVMASLNAFFSSGLPVGLEPPEIIGIVVNEKGLERALATCVGLGLAGLGFAVGTLEWVTSHPGEPR